MQFDQSERKTERQSEGAGGASDASLPNCVFAPPGGGPRTLYGLSPSGDLIHIADAPRGAGRLVCPDCGGSLIARKGDIRIPHFSHATGSECTHAGETALHRIAKDIIASGGDLLLPASQVQGLDGVEVMHPETHVQFDAVDIETWEDGIRPDLVGMVSYTRNGASHTRRMIIEIRVTHKVGVKKLEMLKGRGESVLEIDLSKVERGLDGEAFSRMVLEEAPRQWLYHRIIEERQREVARQRASRDRIRERRKAYAISMSEKEAREREEALLSSPVAARSDDLSWADEEWRRWALVDHGEFLLVPVEDGVFDVPPSVWRAAALQVIAPWREGREGLPFRPELEKIAEEIGKNLRKRGWVKEPFAGDLTTFRSGRKQRWDPVGEEIYAFLDKGFAAFRYTMRSSYERGDIEVAEKEVQSRWRDVQSHIGAVLHLSESLRHLGFDLRAGGRLVSSGGDVERALVSGSEAGDRATASWAVSGLLRWIGAGRSLKDLRGMIERLLGAGYSVRRRKGRHDLPAGKLTDILGSMRVRELDAELSEWTWEQADDLLSVFLSQFDRMPVLRPALGAEGFGFLYELEGIAGHLAEPLMLEERDPVFAAKAEVEKRRKALQRIAWELSRIADLADHAAGEQLAELIRGEGIAICLRHAADRGRRHARGLHRQEDLEAAMRMIEELEGIAARRGYGEGFTGNAMKSVPPGVQMRLLDLVFSGEKVGYRKAMAEIRTLREKPKWIS